MAIMYARECDRRGAIRFSKADASQSDRRVARMFDVYRIGAVSAVPCGQRPGRTGSERRGQAGGTGRREATSLGTSARPHQMRSRARWRNGILPRNADWNGHKVVPPGCPWQDAPVAISRACSSSGRRAPTAPPHPPRGPPASPARLPSTPSSRSTPAFPCRSASARSPNRRRVRAAVSPTDSPTAARA